ncbi:MAG: 2-C-methyl-D-erythritol 2,4-cyclodiphosphate synthase, partial [Actinomycetia bacterium]|nr:2-C-methyl-D-erythritol 2,4-cyclodiphosphate synthase [Actinomycetes bacterium]
EGYKVGNLDTVVLSEEPKLAPWRDKMRENISSTLDIDINQVSVKATTAEGMGFTGRGEGISAQAIVLIEKAGI